MRGEVGGSFTETQLSNRPVFCVDWDGTGVEEVWPGMGDWLPGAPEALRLLSLMGKTVIYSLRCHLFEMDDETPRPRCDVAAEVFAIRRKLDDAGLHDIDVYPPSRGKPPAEFYIDDRAVRFDGDWRATMSEVTARRAR